jgi:hypothetical protein
VASSELSVLTDASQGVGTGQRQQPGMQFGVGQLDAWSASAITCPRTDRAAATSTLAARPSRCGRGRELATETAQSVPHAAHDHHAHTSAAVLVVIHTSAVAPQDGHGPTPGAGFTDAVRGSRVFFFFFFLLLRRC